MANDILTIRELGEKICWTLVEQAIGIPDATMHTDFMAEKVAVLFFGEPSLPERLCVSAAVRQMGGAVVYEFDPTGDHWRRELHKHQLHLLPIFDFYLDCVYLYGIPMSSFRGKDVKVSFPTINAGSPDAHPAHALADIAYMLKMSRYLNSVSCAWLGTPNGTLYSLIAASEWFPFTLRIAIPEHCDPTLLKVQIGDGNKVELVDSIAEAVRDTKFIFVGSSRGIDYPNIKKWELSPETFVHADKNFKLLLAARPINTLPLDDALTVDHSVLIQQSEFRLRIHKRMLHYAFGD